VGATGTASGESWVGALEQWALGEALRPGARPLLETALPLFERTMIEVALRRTQGHRQNAAKLLGWGRNTLTRKIKELGMDDGGGEDVGGEAAA
jgi:two-component system nitrogen regulation response regulator GlnG